MASMQELFAFAQKWLEKFQDPTIDYRELVGADLANDCDSLGFRMDCGHGFGEKYGRAGDDAQALRAVKSEITDVPLLGSAIYSQWRYFNHWSYSGEEILAPGNREWFILALERLGELSAVVEENGTE